MRIQFLLHALGELRTLVFLRLFQTKAGAVFFRFFGFGFAGERLAGFAEFYDVVIWH